MPHNPDAAPPSTFVCAECNQVLIVRQSPDGDLEVRHPGPIFVPDDHPPVPVPVESVDANAVAIHCDFCVDGVPKWLARCTPFTLADLMPGDDYIDDGEWAACDTCKDLIEAGAWDALMARHITLAESKWGRVDTSRSRRLQEAFAAHFVGEVMAL